MIIDDLDIQGVTVLKPEAHTPLIVNANAPLTFAVITQGFQPVAGWDTKVFERVCIVKHLQLALGNIGQCLKFTGAFSLEQCLCVPAMEGLDRCEGILRLMLNVKRLDFCDSCLPMIR
jgi:hypothetical protein